MASFFSFHLVFPNSFNKNLIYVLVCHLHFDIQMFNNQLGLFQSVNVGTIIFQIINLFLLLNKNQSELSKAISVYSMHNSHSLLVSFVIMRAIITYSYAIDTYTKLKIGATPLFN